MTSERPRRPPVQAIPRYADGRELATPEALELAEWELISYDLDICLRNFSLLVERYDLPIRSEEDRAIFEALYRDAVVQLMGCFTNKDAKLSKDEVGAGLKGGKESIAYLQDLRDTFAAHNFGPQRQCYILALPEAKPGQIGFTPLRVVFSLPVPEVMPDYVKLVEVAKRIVKRKTDVLRDAVLRQVLVMGLEGINALPPYDLVMPENDELRMSRKGFRAVRAGLRPRGRGGSGDQTP
ncbi:MAG: hypothetical protein Q8K11_01330 [Phenylobacterium sp.]|uniref:hypothetical protein n=1 Tax=Phenylobacterium sp. TaxID=1871053 RepID=UPI00272F37FD|nr:hypothetical protein [Phenylobacterium sp.]MDP2008794.1 hypothetical protein [Phenylobacterium sp.]